MGVKLQVGVKGSDAFPLDLLLQHLVGQFFGLMWGSEMFFLAGWGASVCVLERGASLRGLQLCR